MKRNIFLLAILLLILIACTSVVSTETGLVVVEPTPTFSNDEPETITPSTDEVIPTETSTPENQEWTPTPISIPTQTPQSIGVSYSHLPESSNWQQWPELPVFSDAAVEIYRTGLNKGTDPHAFSVFGDCQSLPDAFWGRYDDPGFQFTGELAQLESAANWYAGSFDRESVTVKKGTTTAAILWNGWLDGDDHSCEYGESPLACELRIHNPSIVIISLGTHWELRNDQYLRKILDQLIEQGVLPIISTKADHREGEAWVNEEMISIAQEYQLPVWNFWTAVQSLENQGMKDGDPMYMTDEGLDAQRISGLKVLNEVLQVLWSEE